MGKYITDYQYNVLKNNALDSSARFMNGEISNAFDIAMNNDVTKVLSNAAVTAGGAISIAQQYPSEVLQVCQDLITYIVGMILDTTIYDTTKKVAEIAIPDTAFISQMTQTVFNENKMSLSEALASISESKETQQQKEVEETNEKDKEEKFSKLKNMANSVTTWLNDNVQPITDKVNELINQYALYDPTELDNQLIAFVNSQKEKLTNVVDQKLNDAKLFKTTIETNIATTAGKYLADQYNTQIIKQANQQLHNVNKVKAKAKQMAAAATQFAKLQVMALTGVNIP